MPIRSEWKLAREGVTGDTLGRALKYTAFNPALTLPLVLLARYTAKGNLLAAEHATAFKHLKTLLALGALSAVSGWLDDRVLNNWSADAYDWSKEIVVVTGGSDGIGKIVVQLLAERGVKVAVLDVQELAFEAPPTVTYFHCDLASHASIAAAATAIRSSLGAPTVLINNAGCARGKTILAASESDIRLTFNVNTLSHYFLTQQFLPAMLAANHGMIVTVASLAAYVSAPSMVDYAASKAAALAFHEGLSAELASIYKANRIRTVIMCQGYTRTALFEGFDSAVLHAETVAEEIVKAVLRGKSAHLVAPETGWVMAPKIRGWPLWMQYGMRKRLDNLMRGWRGRQVVQPSESETGGKGKESVEGSTVLVEGEGGQ
ncbi:short chain dehydrogenase/reductase family protein-like protein [Trematosphaeria pertusa]|uniref:Short-chain dehydrogenase/reductase 3 n=1 Tax=Trematosphaeria pertusa TaxID=390896 RepID=A0A6A6I3H7_9PLEO|nr:short chain dehydrogenase/reductase family protein-like protein [Trematosphaeria pertusa]KAF2244548.1 short chain dehydrogenase/reductase family protein-like protein [Trematosphaeria pertusa]